MPEASAVTACSSSVRQAGRSQSRIKTLDMSHLLHAQVLASDVNIGYEEIVNTQVHQVNGKPVKNLSDLTRQIEGCEDQYLRFDLEYNQVWGALSQIVPCSVLCLTRRMHSGFSLTYWISDTHSQGYTNLQSLVKCLNSGFCALKQYMQFACAKVSLGERGSNVLCFWPLHVYPYDCSSYPSCDCSWSF